MKKIIGTVFVLTLLSSCGGDTSTDENSDISTTEIEAIESETSSLDSIADVIEQTATDIEASTQELNDALNEL